MPKVALLGDSIRLIGYGKRVPALLGDSFQVVQPEDNCRFSSYMLRVLYDWQSELRGCDVIHWNCGLWDVCDLFGDGPFTPLEQYCETMVRIGKLLSTFAPAVIFATTTVPKPTFPGHSVARIAQYNQAIVPRLQALGEQINDLFSPVAADTEKFICDDGIHLNAYGTEVCAGMVADSIRASIANRSCL